MPTTGVSRACGTFHVPSLALLLVASTVGAQDRLYIEDQTVVSGSSGVEVPVLLDNAVEKLGFSLSVKYEADKLELVGVEVDGTAAATAGWSMGTIFPEEGSVTWAVVMGLDVENLDFTFNDLIPRGEGVVVARLLFNVLASPGSTAMVRLEDGAGESQGFHPGRNVLTQIPLQAAEFPQTVVPELGAPATLTLVGDAEPFRFVRGDCNGDGATGGTADAVAVLSFNFLGTAVFSPTCIAACDADGDGQVGGLVADALYLLGFNFAGTNRPPPAPWPDCGPPAGESDLALGCETPHAVCNP